MQECWKKEIAEVLHDLREKEKVPSGWEIPHKPAEPTPIPVRVALDRF